MDLPKRVRIGPIVYPVIQVEGLKDTDGSTLFGMIRFSRSEIQIEASLEDRQRMQVLLHEIFHAIFAQINARDDENLVDALAWSWLGVLLDNPQLAHCINPDLYTADLRPLYVED